MLKIQAKDVREQKLILLQQVEVNTFKELVSVKLKKNKRDLDGTYKLFEKLCYYIPKYFFGKKFYCFFL